MNELPKYEKVLSDEERVTLVHALRAIRNKVRWKPGKDIIHLKKRQRMKHLSISAPIADYEQLIYDIVRNGDNIVYFYDFSGSHYYAIRGLAPDDEWLVLFGQGGVMETAFPPENMDEYLERRGFMFLGRVEEILEWIKEANT